MTTGIKSFNEWRDEVELFHDRMPTWYWNRSDRLREYDNYVHAARKRLTAKRVKKFREVSHTVAAVALFYLAIVLAAYLLAAE